MPADDDLESGEESGEEREEPSAKPARDAHPGALQHAASIDEEDEPADDLKPSRWDAAHDSEEGDGAHASGSPSTKRSRWADDDGDDVERSAADGAAGSHAGAIAQNGLDGQSYGLAAKPADPDGVPGTEQGTPEEVGQGEGVGAAKEAPAAPERLDMLRGCRSKDEAFDIVKQVGSGTYGLVSKARSKDTNEVRALKKIKLPSSFATEGFPMTSVREINILLALKHPNIVDVTEVVAEKKDIYMVMEFVQQDLKHFLETYKARLKIGEVKRIVQQLLQGMHYLHENWVLHRDLKPANILYDHFGNVKICDFGLARHFGDPVPNMTPMVVTRNYRGPEICLGVTNYTPALDIWSVGVIAAELLTRKVPFVESKSDIDLVNAIGRVIGSPHGQWNGLEKLPKYHKIEITKDVQSTLRQKLGVPTAGALPLALDTSITQKGFKFIESMMRWDPAKRVTAAQALEHEWFSEMPRVTEACFMPQTNDALRRKYA